MKINSRCIFIGISSVVIALYLLAFALDLVYPQYIGVHSLSSLLVFRRGTGIIPAPPSFTGGWKMYMGTTYESILLFPALLGSLKFDFTIMLASLAISASMGIAIGYSAAAIGKGYKKLITYVTKIATSAPYILVMLLVLYIARGTETGIIIAISIGWFPFYVIRSVDIFDLWFRKGRIYDYKKLLFSFTPYFITDLGAITGVVTIITYFGFYFRNPFVLDIGNIMNLGGNVSTYLFSGVWWIIIFPLVFITVFIGFTALLSYELNGGLDNAAS
jgi:peptide/nickel transport system permease protein